MASVLTMDLLDENGDSAEEPEEEDEVNSVKGAALTEDDVGAALRHYHGTITRKMLQKARRSRATAKKQEQTNQAKGPNRRRFYAMTSDHLGKEKALDGSWIDKLQDLLDETADAYGAGTEWQAEVHDAEQKELRDQIGGYLANFFQAGSEGIDTVTSHLVQVWRCLNTPLEATAVADPRDAPPDLDSSMGDVMRSLREARDIGCSRADKMTHQWFAYLTKEVFKVEKFGEHQRIKSLEQLKSRLRLHHTYDELMDRWHRMDNLNAGLDEAVSNKMILRQAVEHAESLLNKQIEAEFHKNFQKETKQLLFQAAKARADLVGQVETQVRHRGVLRAELLMHLSEFSDKLKAWHPKITKKFQEAIHSLKSAKRQADNRKRGADDTLAKLKLQMQRLQSELDQMLTPYTGDQLHVEVDFNTFEVTSCPQKPLLVSRILATVAEREDSIIPSNVLSAVKDLISRRPLERLQQTQALVPEHPIWQDVSRVRELLDFDAIQSRFAHKAAAAADVAHFLVGNKRAMLLLRGPERSRLDEILREFREISAERTFGQSATAAAKLLKRAENLLKVLSAANCRGEGFRRGCVGAEASLIMALLQFGALLRAHRGCKVLAAVHSLRSLQLRKQALLKALEVQPETSTPQEQVRAVEASLRTVAGSLAALAEQAEKLAKDGNAIVAGHGRSLESLLEVTQQLALNRRIDVVTSKGIAQEKIDAHGTEADADGNLVEIDLFPDLPALLVAAPQTRPQQSKQAESGADGRDVGALAVYALKHQQAMMKMHYNLRKWLRNALMPNVSDTDFEMTQEAMDAAQTYLKSQLPVDEPHALSSSSATTSEESGPSVLSPRRSSTLRTLGRASFGDLKEIHSLSPRRRQTDDEDPELSLHQLWRQRSISDLRHDRRLDEFLAQQLSDRFTANADSYRDFLDDSPSHASEGRSSSSEEELPQEILEKRSQATFLRWASSATAMLKMKPKAKPRAGLRQGSNWHTKARETKESASSSSPSPRRLALTGPRGPARVFRDLAGRQVARSTKPASSMAGSGAVGVTSESDAPASPYIGDDSSPERTAWTPASSNVQHLVHRQEVQEEQEDDRSHSRPPHSLRHRARLAQEPDASLSSLVLATSSTARGRSQPPRAGQCRAQAVKSPLPQVLSPQEPPPTMPPLLHHLGQVAAGVASEYHPVSPASVEPDAEPVERPSTPEFPAISSSKKKLLDIFAHKHQPTADDLCAEDAEDEDSSPLAQDASAPCFVRPDSAKSTGMSSFPAGDREEAAPRCHAEGQAEQREEDVGNGQVGVSGLDDYVDDVPDDGLDGCADDLLDEGPDDLPDHGPDDGADDGARGSSVQGASRPSRGHFQAGRIHGSLEDMESMAEPDLYSQSGGPSLANLANRSTISRSRKPLLAEMTPRRGRAFPHGFAEADRSLSGPPGTARRLQLHSRPSVRPRTPCRLPQAPAATVSVSKESTEVEENLRSWQFNRPASAPTCKPKWRPKTPTRPAFGSSLPARA